MLLSLFCGVGGLDWGFENQGFEVGLALDKNPDSIKSYNHNRPQNPIGQVTDISELTVAQLDELYGGRFTPIGVIGGPPCQSFSQANRSPLEDDPRHELPLSYARLLGELNARSPIHFFVLENVTGLSMPPHTERFSSIMRSFEAAGFVVAQRVLNSNDYRVPQTRERLILVGFNREIYRGLEWSSPPISPGSRPTVRSAIEGLPEPVHFRRGLSRADMPFHPNHWCMAPKSSKFSTKDALKPGKTGPRSFKTLSWDKPSITVAYGNREVHIHPNCHRRLSVFEAMRLQGFPLDYELLGTLSDQIRQVSEAVPPPVSDVIAASIREQLTNYLTREGVETARPHPATMPVQRGNAVAALVL